MQYVAREPPADLRPWVTNIWYVSGPAREPYEKILPMPFVHFVVNLAEPYCVIARDSTEPDQSFVSGFVSGVQTRFLLIENPTNIRNFGAEFTALGIEAFTDTRVEELTNHIQSSNNVLRDSEALRDQAMALDSPDATLDLLESYLRRTMIQGFRANPTAALAHKLMTSTPDMAISAVATQCGLSHKSLIATFRRHCGVTPKVFLDLNRFHEFIQSVPRDAANPRWSSLVAESTYYDQAHFVRTFRAFTGVTPTQYVTQMRRFASDDPSFVPASSPELAGG